MSGIVTNGPIPHICVMLIATAERSPIPRSNPEPRVTRARGRGSAPERPLRCDPRELSYQPNPSLTS